MNDVIVTTPSLFLEGLLAGTFVGSMMLEQAAGRLELADWIPYSQTKEAAYGSAMPTFFAATLLASILAAIFGAEHRTLTLAALALGLAGVITVRIHLPLNAAFKTWSRQHHPADADDLRTRWRRWNVARGVLAIAAFALAI